MSDQPTLEIGSICWVDNDRTRRGRLSGLLRKRARVGKTITGICVIRDRAGAVAALFKPA